MKINNNISLHSLRLQTTKRQCIYSWTEDPEVVPVCERNNAGLKRLSEQTRDCELIRFSKGLLYLEDEITEGEGRGVLHEREMRNAYKRSYRKPEGMTHTWET
jgi:hypothetical protein